MPAKTRPASASLIPDSASSRPASASSRHSSASSASSVIFMPAEYSLFKTLLSELDELIKSYSGEFTNFSEIIKFVNSIKVKKEQLETIKDSIGDLTDEIISAKYTNTIQRINEIITTDFKTKQEKFIDDNHTALKTEIQQFKDDITELREIETEIEKYKAVVDKDAYKRALISRSPTANNLEILESSLKLINIFNINAEKAIDKYREKVKRIKEKIANFDRIQLDLKQIYEQKKVDIDFTTDITQLQTKKNEMSSSDLEFKI